MLMKHQARFHEMKCGCFCSILRDKRPVHHQIIVWRSERRLFKAVDQIGNCRNCKYAWPMDQSSTKPETFEMQGVCCREAWQGNFVSHKQNVHRPNNQLRFYNEDATVTLVQSELVGIITSP